MKQRATIKRASVWIAASAMGAFVMLWIVSYRVDFWHGGVEVIGDVHVMAFRGTLWVYNGDLPYSGGILRMASDGRRPRPPYRWIGCNFPVYFRYIRWEGPPQVPPVETIWSLGMPIYLPVLISGVALVWLVLRDARAIRARRMIGMGLCPGCGYDSRDAGAVSGVWERI